MKESALVKAILLEAANYPTKLKIWRNNVGATQYTNKKTKKTYFVKFGFAGMSDLIGIRNDGKFIGIECKIGKNEPTPLQSAFAQMVKDYNGVYVLAYEVDDWKKVFEGM